MPLPDNLLPEPPPTLLPDDAEPRAALAEGRPAAEVAARWPASSLAWSRLAQDAWAAGDVVASYAYARTGYHRGLDALRRHGWKGSGPVPLRHPGNEGFLRCLAALGRAAGAIGEDAEAARCAQFLADCDPAAPSALAAGR